MVLMDKQVIYNQLHKYTLSVFPLRLLYLTLPLDTPRERLYYRLPLALEFPSGGSHGPEA